MSVFDDIEQLQVLGSERTSVTAGVYVYLSSQSRKVRDRIVVRPQNHKVALSYSRTAAPCN